MNRIFINILWVFCTALFLISGVLTVAGKYGGTAKIHLGIFFLLIVAVTLYIMDLIKNEKN